MIVINRIYLDSAAPPKFVVLVIADIKKGFQVNTTICIEDLKKYQLGALPYEEYVQRVLTDSASKPEIIGDDKGAHLLIHDIAWPSFLTNQAINRIKFKYQQSISQPSMDTEKETVKIFAQTLANYGYTGYQRLELHDLRFDSRYEYNPSQIKDIAKKLD